ncbi:hypothetical protein [Sphingobacterium deserti]|uniref:Uncharacterized protein n=1 Tax=Sphingobacterium deserti TaxID=1229276 RepID=A0A0B8T0C8_9SPHI|nr:hypothetical protein [Sphingobacterium deserti]KGE13962.1 hypothetical protein DI53_2156 [Sphingobacterium deserti]
MKKEEAEKLVLVGTLLSSSHIFLLMLSYYMDIKWEPPHFLQVIGSMITEMLTLPAITFLIVAFLFGLFKLIRKRFNGRIFTITAISFVAVLLIILTWE